MLSKSFKTMSFYTLLTVGIVSFSTYFAQAQQFMSQKDLLATLPGSQVSGIANSDNKTPWVQAYSKYNGRKKRGSISGLWNKEEYQSSWYVKKDHWCEKWDGGQRCWQVERVGDKKLRVYLAGQALKNLWIIK
ncbi:hypothetical protein ACMAZE_02685 [Pseudopelagicola sp. nBUS_20]|uniref:hypothetical protein n=1 Tax=Pseudopelagicola sp. nBUS_20 TaxID=3395317 RepID=UPI003EC0BCF8